MASIVTVNGLSLEFPNGYELFNKLNLNLDDRLTALVGPNGVGKTCLARLLAGELEPTDGVIRRFGKMVYLAQREAPENISVQDYLGPEHEWSLTGERLLCEMDRQALCATLSGGQWMRVRLARVLEDSYLLLDEPTNDLDREGREAVLDFLRNRQGGALLISHDRECLGLVDEVLELSNRGLSRYGGGWTAYIEAKEREREGLKSALEEAERVRDAAFEERMAQRARQEKRNRRGAQASARGGQAKILLGTQKRRAQATTGKLETSLLERAQESVRAAHEAFDQMKIDPVMYADLICDEIPAQKLVVEAQDFNVLLNQWLYSEDLNFSWRGNVRVALKGRNGSGKSTLLKAIIGETYETRGKLRRGDLATLYVDQSCSALDDERSVFENARAVSSLSESEIRSGLARFLFAKETVFKKVRDLSGGERLRAALARGFLGSQRPELLVLDEPTNNLDLVNIEFLEGLVREFRGALVIVSHDEDFLKNCGVEVEFRVG